MSVPNRRLDILATHPVPLLRHLCQFVKRPADGVPNQKLRGKAARILKALLSLLPPPVIDFRRMLQGLHYHAILFGFLLQGA